MFGTFDHEFNIYADYDGDEYLRKLTKTEVKQLKEEDPNGKKKVKPNNLLASLLKRISVL